jgi:hypothetical protein
MIGLLAIACIFARKALEKKFDFSGLAFS